MNISSESVIEDLIDTLNKLNKEIQIDHQNIHNIYQIKLVQILSAPDNGIIPITTAQVLDIIRKSLLIYNHTKEAYILDCLRDVFDLLLKDMSDGGFINYQDVAIVDSYTPRLGCDLSIFATIFALWSQFTKLYQDNTLIQYFAKLTNSLLSILPNFYNVKQQLSPRDLFYSIKFSSRIDHLNEIDIITCKTLSLEYYNYNHDPKAVSVNIRFSQAIQSIIEFDIQCKYLLLSQTLSFEDYRCFLGDGEFIDYKFHDNKIIDDNILRLSIDTSGHNFIPNNSPVSYFYNIRSLLYLFLYTGEPAFHDTAIIIDNICSDINLQQPSNIQYPNISALENNITDKRFV